MRIATNGVWLVWLCCAFAATEQDALAAAEVKHPVFPPQHAKRGVASLIRSVEPVMKLSERQLYDLVPTCSGIYYCGCPNCNAGSQEHEIAWNIDEPNIVRCKYCKMVMPNEKFPANKKIEIIAPSGVKQVYRYHESPDGRQFFFEARGWYGRWGYLNQAGWLLGDLYALTGKQEYADRAAIIIGRFAQVFPDYAIRFDYPYRPVRFWPADTKSPVPGITPYRAAKYYWWAYGDVPDKLIRSYDQIYNSGAFDRKADLLGKDIRKRIEDDFFRAAVVWLQGHRDSLGNMSPGMYADFVVAGRVLGEPAFVHEAVRRARMLMQRQFFFDGWWREGAPSYHAQTIGNMARVAQVAKGYSDPPDTQPPAGEKRFVNLRLERDIPMIAKARAVARAFVLPNGRPIPINDTWWSGNYGATKSSRSRLWAGVGHAVLGAGTGANQFQVHLNWSGGYGHTHHDNGSILLFAHGKELLSDIGYTHTRYRNWTINSASHNLVVVDERSQRHGELIEDLTQPENAAKPSDGNLLLMDMTGPRVQVVEVDALPAYSDRCKTYRRLLVHVHAGDGQDYVVDVFDVVGGQVHDLFLHGCADEDGTLALSIPCDQKVPTLVPSWGGRGTYRGESDLDVEGNRFHAYDFVRDVTATETSDPFVATFRLAAGDVRLRAHVLPVGTCQVLAGRSPSIRRARSEDAKLDRYWMPTLILRRKGKDLTSRFVSVLEPAQGQGFIKSVRRIEVGPSLVLQIDRDGGRDWVVINPDHAGRSTVDAAGTALEVAGRVGVVSLAGDRCRWAYLLDGTSLKWGDMTLGGQARWTGALLRAGGDHPSQLITDMKLPIGPSLAGRIALVTHGNGRTHGYVVQRIERHEQGTAVVIDGDCGFDYDAGTATTQLRFFPRWKIKGPARLTVVDRAFRPEPTSQ